MMARRLAWLGATAAVLAVLVIIDILTGPAMLNVGEVLRGLFAPDSASSTTRIIVQDIRLPMTLMAVLVGTSLGTAGVHMQTILGNPLYAGLFCGGRLWRGPCHSERHHPAPGALADRPAGSLRDVHACSGDCFRLCPDTRDEPGNHGVGRDRDAVHVPIGAKPCAIFGLARNPAIHRVLAVRIAAKGQLDECADCRDDLSVRQPRGAAQPVATHGPAAGRCARGGHWRRHAMAKDQAVWSGRPVDRRRCGLCRHDWLCRAGGPAYRPHAGGRGSTHPFAHVGPDRRDHHDRSLDPIETRLARRGSSHRHRDRTDRCAVPVFPDPQTSTEALVSLFIHDFSVSYGRNRILNGITDSWPAGQVTALIGCNGAGKTTLLKAMAGLQVSKGDIALSGALLTPAECRHQIGYMPQDLGAISSLTVLEVVLLGRVGTLKMRVPSEFVDQAMTALEVFGLTDLRARGLDEISGGQRQLVFLAQALFRAPKVLLLDEPTAALDLRHQLLALERLCEHARSSDTIISVAMHDLNLAAQFADRFLALEGGRAVTSGTAPEVLTPDILRLMYGIEAEVSEGHDGCLRIYPLRRRP